MGCGGCGQHKTLEHSAPKQEVLIQRDIPVPESKPSLPVRISCIECVEKHLGSAWVLYTEYKTGYPYKTLIVGHLSEAEAESEKWPLLSIALRDYRKRFQNSDIPPPFDFLALKVLEAKQS